MSKRNKYEGLRYPPLNDLIDKVHNKYELVLAASKRARDIVDGAIPLINFESENPISIATEEIDEGKIQLENPALEAQQEKLKSQNIEESRDEEISQEPEDLNVAEESNDIKESEELETAEEMEDNPESQELEATEESEEIEPTEETEETLESEEIEPSEEFNEIQESDEVEAAEDSDEIDEE